jgi:adenylate kinase
MVTHKDVAALDRILVSFVAKNRRKAHIVVDSHAVTKERDGYRVTAFSFKGFASLRPDAIAVLYTSPSVGAKRVKKAKAGRRMVTNWQAEFHTNLQASLAITYGASLGIPVYFIDGEPPLSEVVQCVARLFQTAP